MIILPWNLFLIRPSCYFADMIPNLTYLSLPPNPLVSSTITHPNGPLTTYYVPNRISILI